MVATTLAVFFYGLLLQQKCSADGIYGYFGYNIKTFRCATEPDPNGLCHFDHEVGNLNENLQLDTGMAQTIANLQEQMHGLEPNSSKKLCLKAKVHNHCKMAFPFNCTHNYLLRDTAGLENSCKTVSTYCPNATEIIESCKVTMNSTAPNDTAQPIKRQGVQCKRFSDIENDQLPCAKKNYKVVADNLQEETKTQLEFYKKLITYGRNISNECLNNVSELICKSVIPACDLNETVVLRLVSWQECNTIISCLNITLRNKFQQLCQTLPDKETSKKILLSSVYIDLEEDIATSPTTQSSTPNNTNQTQNGSTSDSSSPTERPELHSNDYKTSPKFAEKPTMQALITNESLATQKFNVTDKNTNDVKSVPNLEPTTESPTTNSMNQTFTVPTKYNEPSEIPTSSGKPENMEDVKSDPNLKQTTGNRTVNLTNQAMSIPTKQAKITKLIESSEMSTTLENTAGVKRDPTLKSATESRNEAVQLNIRSNALAFLIISVLSMFMWQ